MALAMTEGEAEHRLGPEHGTPETRSATAASLAAAAAAGAFVVPIAGRMAVRRLSLTDFRGYATARIEADHRPVVLTGPNGAGKTNLLEALSFLSPGRGLRRIRLPEATRRDAPDAARWAVAARLDTARGPLAVGTGLDPEAPPGTARRVVRLDGRNAATQAALAEHLAVVWLTPQMDRLFVEGPGNRRRFLDRLVFGFHPDHAAQLLAYERAMRERARLLRDDSGDAAWLGALEHGMAASGVAVAAARREVVARLRAAVEAGPDDRPFPRADLAVEGLVEGWLDRMPAVDAEDALRGHLARMRRADGALGGAADGPHRSDLAVRHRTKDAPAEHCSTGEQKALLIGIVLANARLLEAARGAPPVLLLDEVAAHLDAARREALLETLLALGAQAWLTGTDAALFAGLGSRARHYAVDDARLTEHGG